jgi:hypothetical protein
MLGVGLGGGSDISRFGDNCCSRVKSAARARRRTARSMVSCTADEMDLDELREGPPR